MLEEDFINRVKAIALLDSAHLPATSGDAWQHLKNVTKNWICHPKPLNDILSPHKSQLVQFSAGKIVQPPAYIIAKTEKKNFALGSM